MNNMENQEAAGSQTTEKAAPMEPVFALDIGTRSVIGVVAVLQGDTMRVLDVESVAHTKRAVVDGQIEDIDQTAKIASQVRQSLQERLGTPLRSVCVAAAGRLLRTQRAQAEITFDEYENETITPQQIQQLETGAIEEARRTLPADNEGETMDLYCVGHSVMRYYLDDYPISTLVGHRGKKARVELIATFLPSAVVESLYTAMQKIELSISSITLEPIAAMNAVVPQELRMLNIVLVDIGAGTSDIAISDSGSVTDYTMATVAGDEITEAVMKRYLVDFDMAEKIKTSLSHEPEKIEYQDILGFSHEATPAQVLKEITPEMEALCRDICGRIIEKNGKPPSAVFLAGGGSQLPGLCAMVANELGIEENKVAVGGGNYMKRIASGSNSEMVGPQFATPLGIAVTALQNWERDSFSVTVNGQTMNLFKNGPVRVMDVLLRSGWRYNQIIGRSGRTVTFLLNNEKKVARGSTPIPAEISMDDAPASISTTVRPGCAIVFLPAVSGKDADPVISDFVKLAPQFFVWVNDVRVAAGQLITKNAEPVTGDTAISDLDEIAVKSITTLQELCDELKLHWNETEFSKNGENCEKSDSLKADDRISYIAKQRQAPAENPAQGEQEAQSAPDAAGDCKEAEAENQQPENRRAESETRQPENRQPEAGPPTKEKPQQDNEPPADTALCAPPGIQVTINSISTCLPRKEDGMRYQFVDMLNFVDIDPQHPKGNIVLKLNGEEAKYLDAVREGDIVDIYWEDPVTGALL